MTVRFAVIGCGTAASHIHLPALRSAGAEVTVFASRSLASAEATCSGWGAGAVEARWEDAVERDDVDAVVIATPNAQHHAVAMAALRAGKHVLVDKPMACTVADADEMITAADRSAGRWMWLAAVPQPTTANRTVTRGAARPACARLNPRARSRPPST